MLKKWNLRERPSRRFRLSDQFAPEELFYWSNTTWIIRASLVSVRKQQQLNVLICLCPYSLYFFWCHSTCNCITGEQRLLDLIINNIYLKSIIGGLLDWEWSGSCSGSRQGIPDSIATHPNSYWWNSDVHNDVSEPQQFHNAETTNGICGPPKRLSPDTPTLYQQYHYFGHFLERMTVGGVGA